MDDRSDLFETNSEATLDNPFQAYSLNLAGKRLSLEEKTYLAHLVNNDGWKPIEIGKRYNISRQLVSKYARSVREGRPLYSLGGKPPVLDTIANSELF